MDPRAPDAAGQPFRGVEPFAAGADEIDLVRSILRNDRKAAAQFVAAHIDAVHGYVRHRLSPRADLIDDVVQEVFLAALKGLAAFQGQSSLRTWLIAIARHKIEDVYRHRLRVPEALDDLESVDEEATIEIDERIDRARRSAKARHVLEQMPERYGLLLLWRYWEQRSTRDMAVALGATEKSVERALARARVRFKELWQKESRDVR